MLLRRLPERVVILGAGLLLAITAVGAVRHVGADDSPPAGSAAGTDVSIRDFRFGPDELVVRAGATVTWRNDDGFAHTVEGLDGGGPTRSPDLEEGEEYEFTFAEPGTYEYVCTIHVTMQGTVVVEA